MKRRLISSLLILLIACDDNDQEAKSDAVDSKIIIEARELLTPNGRRLTLLCETEKIYPCANYPILTEEQTFPNAIEITFTSIGEIGICFTAMGPASTTIDLNSISTGEYDLELNNGVFKNRGTLKVTDSDITFQFGQTLGIDFVRTNTKRVLDNTYWGTIGYHTPSSESLVDEFIQKFEDAGAVFSDQAPGHYFYYEIDESGNVVTDVETSGYYFVKEFVFQYDGDESKLKEIVQGEGRNYKETLSMRLETYKGEMFYNWGN
jgi:hypothetical protein